MTAPPASLSRPDLSRVVLIGVDEYTNFHDLPAVTNNVTGLGEVLVDDEAWELPETNISIVLPDCDQLTALDAVRSAASQATDTLVVYFAGHGIVNDADRQLYLALRGTVESRPETALSYEYLRQALLDPRVKAKRKVVILDCCYSGRASSGGMATTDGFAEQTLIDGTYVFSSCAATRKSLAPLGETHTVFTGELLTALREGIGGEAEVLTMDALYRHVRSQLVAKSKPVPQQRNRNGGAQIAVARNRAFRPPEPPKALKPPDGRVKQGKDLWQTRQRVIVRSLMMAVLALVVFAVFPGKVSAEGGSRAELGRIMTVFLSKCHPVALAGCWSMRTHLLTPISARTK